MPGVLLFVVLIYWIPEILENIDPNADVCVVGLQALHLLHGEWTPRLWGTEYQGAFYAVFAAPFLALAPRSGVAITISSLTGGLLAAFWLCRTLRTQLSAPASLVLCLPAVVIAPYEILFAFHPRFWCVALDLATFYCAVRASDARRPGVWLFGAGFLCGTALCMDLFSGFYLPAILLATAFALFGPAASIAEILRRRLPPYTLGWALVALLIGLKVYILPMVAFVPTNHTSVGLQLFYLGHVCAPIAFNLTCVSAGTPGFSHLWATAPWSVAIRWFAAALLMVAVALAIRLAFDRTIPSSIRRFAIYGWVTIATTCALFLKFETPLLIGSTRYLYPMFTALPFVLAPLALRVGPTRLAALTLPFVICAWISAWAVNTAFFGDVTQGAARVELADDRQVIDALRQRQIEYAYAPYWSSYNLTFLGGERPIVMPISIRDDRHIEYRKLARNAPHFAVVVKYTSLQPPPSGLFDFLKSHGYLVEPLALRDYAVFIASSAGPQLKPGMAKSSPKP